jgi:DNA-binding CsgD family transcriptional regulator
MAPTAVPARAAPAQRFKAETLAFLAGLVDVTGAVFYDVDRDLNAVDHALHRLDAERLGDYVTHFHELDPLHPRRLAASGRTVVMMEDVVIRGAFERSSYYRDFFAPVGGHHEVELYLRDGDRMVGGISLLRGPEHPSFGTAEIALLAKVRTYVEYTFGIERRIAAAARAVGGLTPREIEVVHLVCSGASNGGIGRELGIALPTVKTHLEHVYEKLGVRTRAQLVARVVGVAPRTARDIHRPADRPFG